MNNRISLVRMLLFLCLLLPFAAASPVSAQMPHLHENFGWNTLPVHTLFENHGAPMLLIDPETGVILHGNRAAREFYGYPDLCGMKLARIDALPPEEVEREIRLAESRKENHFHSRHRMADGTERDVEVYSYLVPVEKRDVLYSVVIDRTEVTAARRALDERNLWTYGLLFAGLLAQSVVLLLLANAVARRKKAEHALEKQLSFARSLIEVIPNPVFYKDRQGRYLGCNEAFRTLKGRTDDEILGKTVYDMGPKELADEYRRTDDNVFASLEPLCYESYVLDRTGGRRDAIFNKAPFFDGNGRAAGLVGVITDITEHKRTEEELRTTRDSLDKLIQYANAPIVVWDKDFRIIRFNRAFERMTGYSSEEALGRPLDMLFPDESREESLGRIRETLAGELWEMVEIPIARKSGEMRFALWNSANVFADDGVSLVATIAQGVDITERKRTEEELRRTLANAQVLRREAETANRAKSAFLANMSHEIRTPLNGVIGFIGLIADTPLDETQREYVGHIDTSAHLLLDILSNVLDISKIEAERLDLHPAPSNLRGAVERSLAPIRAAAAEKGISLSSSVDENVPERAVFDPVRLEQVLVNLLSNAVKFTERGGVELSVWCASSTKNEGTVVFSVKDTGIGIPPEERARIFDPFHQVDSSNTRRYGGAGLGLSICRLLLQKMKSSLEVESVPGEGSRFSFALRLDFGAEAAEPPSGEAAAAPLPGGWRKENPVVLIVEDDWLNMKMLSAIVSKIAHTASVVQAEDGARAVALFRERRPNLVFMDLQMPVKDGFEATAEIRAMEKAEGAEGRRCRIVALTADVLPETRSVCLAGGMDEYLAKPVRREEIRTVIERCLGINGSNEKARKSGSA